jgi:hypothetical protein
MAKQRRDRRYPGELPHAEPFVRWCGGKLHHELYRALQEGKIFENAAALAAKYGPDKT